MITMYVWNEQTVMFDKRYQVHRTCFTVKNFPKCVDLKNLLSFTNVINLLTSDWRLHWIWSTGYQSNVSAAYETRVFLGRFQRISVPVTGIQYEIHSAQGQGWSRCSRRLVFRKLSQRPTTGQGSAKDPRKSRKANLAYCLGDDDMVWRWDE